MTEKFYIVKIDFKTLLTTIFDQGPYTELDVFSKIIELNANAPTYTEYSPRRYWGN